MICPSVAQKDIHWPRPSVMGLGGSCRDHPDQRRDNILLHLRDPRLLPNRVDRPGNRSDVEHPSRRTSRASLSCAGRVGAIASSLTLRSKATSLRGPTVRKCGPGLVLELLVYCANRDHRHEVNVAIRTPHMPSAKALRRRDEWLGLSLDYLLDNREHLVGRDPD